MRLGEKTERDRVFIAIFFEVHQKLIDTGSTVTVVTVVKSAPKINNS